MVEHIHQQTGSQQKRTAELYPRENETKTAAATMARCLTCVWNVSNMIVLRKIVPQIDPAKKPLKCAATLTDELSSAANKCV